MQSEQQNSPNDQDNPSHQLPILRDKFNMPGRGSGNLPGRLTAVALPTVALLGDCHCGALPGNQQNFPTPTKRQPPPFTNYDWDMATLGPTSYGCPTTTQPDASAQNQFNRQTPSAGLPIIQRGKGKSWNSERDNTTRSTVYPKGYSSLD